MIPFCWFGASLTWLGDHNFTGTKGFNIYQNQYAGINPKKLLKWCNAFKQTFPLNYGDCYTTKMQYPGNISATTNLHINVNDIANL